MSFSHSTTMTWSCLNTKEDLLKLFTGRVDQDVIEIIIESRNNDLLLAYRDLIQLTDPIPKLEVSLNEAENQAIALADSNIPVTVDWEQLSKNQSPSHRILYLVSKGYKVMVFMRGCPGSGKSYQATNILKQCYENANIDDFIFSADKFFINKRTGRYNFNHNKLSEAHKASYEGAVQAVKYETTPIIIDNTNTEAWEMENYAKLGVNNGYWIEILEPNSEWAWEGYELYKRGVHNVPYDVLINMLHRYDHSINVDNLLTRLKLKYNKKNQPPQLSNSSKKYQLNDNLTNKIQLNSIKTIDINNQLENLHLSQEYSVANEKNTKLSDFDCSDSYTNSELQSKSELSVTNELENLSHDISSVNENIESLSPIEEASKFADKSVNTYENDFLFMSFLDEIPPEEYSPYVIFGKYRDINEGNLSILNMPSGQLNKGTTTNDIVGSLLKPSLDELRKQFPENVCILITELFDKCEGNIDWIVDVLVESGHDVSKQQLSGLFQFEENNFVESIQVRDTIEKLRRNNVQIKQDNKFPTTQNFQVKNTAFTENTIEETNSEKKKHMKKMVDSKGKKVQTIVKHLDGDLRKDIESKFVFGDSLYSEHVLKIKKLKEGYNVSNCGDVSLASELETVDENSTFEKTEEENFVQLVVDTSVLAQLCDYFGDSSSDLSKSTLPMSVKLPEKFAEDLYYYLIANVPNIKDQETILQDENMAKKLQEECKEQNSSNMSNSSFAGGLTFAAVLSKKLALEKFKDLDPKLVLSVLHSKDYKFEETYNVLSSLSGIGFENQDNQNEIENEESYFDESEYNKPHSNENYRQEALDHAYVRQQFLNKAKQSANTKIHPAVTAYYLERAEESQQNEKYAKTKALVAMLAQNENNTTLDLHYLQVQEAILVLDLYLDNHISTLKKLGGLYSRGRQLTIITGRGKHSPNGIARIRPVVLRRLQIRRLTYMEPEKPGLIMVIVKKNSLLSSEL